MQLQQNTEGFGSSQNKRQSECGLKVINNYNNRLNLKMFYFGGREVMMNEQNRGQLQTKIANAIFKVLDEYTITNRTYQNILLTTITYIYCQLKALNMYLTNVKDCFVN